MGTDNTTPSFSRDPAGGAKPRRQGRRLEALVGPRYACPLLARSKLLTAGDFGWNSPNGPTNAPFISRKQSLGSCSRAFHGYSREVSIKRSDTPDEVVLNAPSSDTIAVLYHSFDRFGSNDLMKVGWSILTRPVTAGPHFKCQADIGFESLPVRRILRDSMIRELAHAPIQAPARYKPL